LLLLLFVDAQGRHFGPTFDIGDTVGCGVRRSSSDETRSSVFFTNNGDLLPSGDRDILSDYVDWYPVVGVDSPNAVHVNFGQEPFRYDGVIGKKRHSNGPFLSVLVRIFAN
jgi:hypothetical protein